MLGRRGAVTQMGAWCLLWLLCLSSPVFAETETTLPLRPAREGHTRGCPWCSGMPNGYHGDTTTTQPCRRFFRCQNERLAEVGMCPLGLCYDSECGECVEDSICFCPSSVHEKIHLNKPRNARPCQKNVEGQTNLGRRMMLHARQATEIRSPKKAAINGEWDQVNALLAFKISNGDPNGKMVNWTVPPGFPTDQSPIFVCLWAGVSCSKGNKVSISSLKITGDPTADIPRRQSLWGLGQSIPPQFSVLAGLEALDLSYNGVDGTHVLRFGGLTGSIPTELCLCTRLTTLNLQYNALTGPIPDCISQLSQLQALNLGYNMLTGHLPDSIGSLTNLSALAFASNGLSGTIPSTLSALTAISIMQFKYLALNGSIPSSLGSMPALTLLEFSNLPALNSPFPSFLAKMNLQYIIFDNTPVSGTLDKEDWLGRMPSLVYFRIRNTSVSGSLPSSLGSLSSLTNLYISYSNISGPINDTLFASGGLQSLNLSTNAFTGVMPHAWSKCSSLSTLDLSFNSLSGKVLFPPLQLLENSTLQNFILAGNKLSGSLPSQVLKKAPSLQWFDVSSNLFSGPLPAFDCGDPSLGGSSFLFQDNQFTGDAEPFLRGVGNCNVVQVDLSRNKLHGRLPASLLSSSAVLSPVASGIPPAGKKIKADGNSLTGNVHAPTQCQGLQSLSLSGNSLSGSVPWEVLAACTSLSFLDLSMNNLNGSMPHTKLGFRGIGGALQVLNLQENNLNGGIPTWIKLLNTLQALNISNNNFSGPLPPEISSILLLSSVDVSSNSMSGSIPPQLARLYFLTRLSLASNHLSGSIPLELAPPNLERMVLLNLSWNDLSGNIPFSFGNFTNSSHVLDLTHNNLTGSVPPGTLSSSPESVANNPFLCGGAGYDPCTSDSSSSSPRAGLVLGLILGGIALFPGLLVVVPVCNMLGTLLVHAVMNWIILRPKKKWSGELALFTKMDPPLTIEHLLVATKNFNDEFKLGGGGFGSVYRATLRDGTELAVKRLTAGISHGTEEFLAEMEILGRVSHRNVVKLIAAFQSTPPNEERILVYEFLPGGSLDVILKEELAEESEFRKFEVRLRVAIEVARGLKYLNCDCTPGIIHRDMKPGNVLLDSDLVAKVADFGLAIELDRTQTHATGAGCMGTPGYIAPEYAFRNRFSVKSDVYAFGVTLIQLMTGRQATDAEIAEQGLRRWAQSGVSILDPRMTLLGNEEALAMGAIKLGLMCTAQIPVDRPPMETVLDILVNLDSFVDGVHQNSP